MSLNIPASRTRVGKYELGRTIGEGSFAKVKFAKNVQTGDTFAVKIIDRDQVLRYEMTEQLKREISIMKLIKHPNVIQIIEVMASKKKIYLVLEFVDGGELFDKIAKYGRFKEDEARRYFQQLINAVDYCHSRGVYHRDLKPENLLLDVYGVLKVSDFGLSALSQQAKGDGLLHTACGTPNYVAPEVIKDKGYDGTASDVWSCGVILYVLTAGYLPFDDPNLMSLYRKICRADFTCPSWFSSGAKKLIKRILDPNPQTRISIGEILEDEWFKKGYEPPQFNQEEDVDLGDVKAAFNDSKENLVTERKDKPTSMNAFELISMTRGLSLEKLFDYQANDLKYFRISGETNIPIMLKTGQCDGAKKSQLDFFMSQGLAKRETRFASQCPPNEIMSRIEETARPLGYDIDKRNYKMKLKGCKTGRKGQLAVATELERMVHISQPWFRFTTKQNFDVFEVAPSLHMVEVRKLGGDTLEFHKFYKSLSSGLKDIVWKSEDTLEGRRS